MLRQVFDTVWYMSLTAGYVILLVLLIRLLLCRTPRIFSYILWSAAAVDGAQAAGMAGLPALIWLAGLTLLLFYSVLSIIFPYRQCRLYRYHTG